MGSCCYKNQSEVIDSDQLIRTYDTITASQSDIGASVSGSHSITPYMIMPDGKKKQITEYQVPNIIPRSV